MSWRVFAILAFIFLAVQEGLAPALSISGTELGQIRPQFVLLLAVTVALGAAAQQNMAAWAVLGLIMDLATVRPMSDGTGLTFIGPYTFGFMAAAIVSQQLRGVVHRRHPLSVVFMVLMCGLAVHLVVVCILGVRNWLTISTSWYGVPIQGWTSGWPATRELGRGLIEVAYTAVFGFLLAAPLFRLHVLLGFSSGRSRRLRVA